KAKLRVEVYADDVIRVRYTPDGTFRDKTGATFVDPTARWGPVDYTVEESDAAYTVHTAKLDVQVDKATGAVSYYDKEGNQVAAEGSRSATNVNLNGQTYYTVTQRFVAAKTEYLYGFGNVENAVGLRGTAVAIQQSNTQKRTPMFYSNQGYGILFDVTCNGQLGWTGNNAEYYYAARATDSMDYYFFYGPDADSVIAGYRQVTGTATMLPKNSFGYVQSRNRYPNQKALLDNVKMFRDKGIPLDVTVVDYYWWQGDFNNITQWNRNDWPDAAAMMQELHDMHVTASISVWPSFKAGTPTYNTVSKVEGFLLPTDSNFGYNYDPTTAANRSYYWDLINQNVFSKGFDSIWLDACEPETSNWVSNSTGELTADGLNSRVIGLSYPLLTNQAAYEGQRAIAGNEKRVNTLTRGAVAGIQRYGTQSWSGDVASTWAQLEKEIRGALNYSAAGLPYFSTDTGGYFGIDTGNEANREMFLRWLQFSTFSGIMRVHGEGCIKEPWSFGAEYEEYIVSMINLRERMVPYIYSLAGAVTQEHGSIMRPLVFDYRTDPNVWTIDDQYMFGPSYMVCPVDSLGTRVRDIYLPAGNWINFWTGEVLHSEGEHFTVTAALDEMPVFVKAGAVIPMAMDCQYVDEIVDEHEIRVYMGADGTFTLYEDEGNNYNYENGAFSTIELSYDEASRTLTIGDRKGAYEGMPETRQFHVVFVQEEYGTGVLTSKEYQTTVTYTGEATSVTFDPDWETPIPPLKLSPLPKPGAAPKPQSADRALVGEW
ncbi:MAG: glycoside hydrolase family 31 protein, partial [Clostridia bacterium]|nr:glycoside hydrolase family 31 protein [Clostridia bacterium]